MRRHFGYDPAYGMDEVFHYQDDQFAIEARQDVEPILDINKRQANDGDGWTPSRDMRHIARIPNVVVEKWLNDYGVNVFNKDHLPAVKRLLNDPEWRYLRVSGGRY